MGGRKSVRLFSVPDGIKKFVPGVSFAGESCYNEENYSESDKCRGKDIQYRMKNNLLCKTENRNKALLWIGLIATVIRLGLFVRYPYVASDSGTYDDVYLLERAAFILEGAWLGEYDHVTLIKGASFPLFVALGNLLCMPYSMLLGLFYIAAAAVFCHALRYITGHKWAALLSYLYLIFSPVGFDVNVTQRIYRNAVVFPSVLLVIGCILLVYYKRNGKIFAQMPWLLLTGIAFSFFYYIREDSIWLLPFLLCALMVTAVWYIWFSGYDKKRIAQRCVLLILPLAVFGGSIGAYRMINYENYGVANINDRSGGAFATLTGNIIKIQDESNTDPDLWITRDTLERVTEACPSLRENKEVYMTQYDNWAVHHPQCGGNVPGDLSVWAIREAMDRLGVYADAQTQEAFCSRVNEELLTAVEEGILAFDDALHFTTQSRGIYLRDLLGHLWDTLRNAYDVLTYRDAVTGLQESAGPKALLDFMENITGVKTIRHDYEYSEVRGWVVVTDPAEGDVTVRLQDGVTGNYLTGNLSLYERADVATAFPEEPRARYSGFAIELDSCIDLQQTELTVYIEDRLLGTSALKSEITDSYILNIDAATADIVPDYNREYSAPVVAVGERIIRFCKWIAPVLLLLAFAVYLFRIVIFLKKRTWENFEPVIILSGLLLSILIVVFGVTVFSCWLTGIAAHAIWFYSCGAVPLGQAFVAMSLLYAAGEKPGGGSDQIAA